MAGNTKAERDFCIAHFPDLEHDGCFKVTSDPDAKYNCIGFAIGFNDIWVAPSPRTVGPSRVPWFWWPSCVPFDSHPDSLIHTFEYFGFEICNDDKFEPGYDKVALYSHEGRWTHAARIIAEGVYHSKLGECHDIIHRRGDVMENTTDPNESYGQPFVFMRRRIQERSLLINRRPHIGVMRYAGQVFQYLVPNHGPNMTSV